MPYRSTKFLTNLLTGVFLFVMLLDVTVLVLSLAEAQFFPGILNKEGVETGAEMLYLICFTIAGGAKVFMIVPLAVLFLMWIYRANANARTFGIDGMKFTPGWSAGWFLIPIMNLFKPYQAVVEIARVSRPDSTADNWNEREVAPVIGWWWALWILNCILGRIDLKTAMSASPEAQRLSPWITSLSVSLDFVTAILAIMVIRHILVMQEEKAKRLGVPRAAA